MSIDLTEISQKVLDNNTNAANVFKKQYDLHYNSNAIDVPFEYIDENGIKQTTNIPNVAKFRKRVWDDVGGALGQFNRTFYVDAENGDDNNDGSSSSPFKTINKAIDSVPVGGIGNIYIIGQYIVNTVIPIIQKNITLLYKDKISFKWYIYDGKARVYYIYLDNATLNFRTDTQSDDPEPTIESINGTGEDVDTANRSIIRLAEYHGTVNIQFFFRNRVEDAKLLDLKDTWFLSSTYGANDQVGTVHLGIGGYYTGNIRLDSNSMLVDVNKCAIVTFKSALNDISYIDEDGNDIDITTKFYGVIKDSDSGNPINLLSNINFSD